MIEKKTVSMCSTSEYCRGWNEAVDAYTLQPMSLDEITETLFATPCWIEIRDEESPVLEFIPDVLDMDSTGYFGRLDTKKRILTRYFLLKDYNRTWRCWRAWVSPKHCEKVEWEGKE